MTQWSFRNELSLYTKGCRHKGAHQTNYLCIQKGGQIQWNFHNKLSLYPKVQKGVDTVELTKQIIFVFKRGCRLSGAYQTIYLSETRSLKDKGFFYTNGLQKQQRFYTHKSFIIVGLQKHKTFHLKQYLSVQQSCKHREASPPKKK